MSDNLMIKQTTRLFAFSFGVHVLRRLGRRLLLLRSGVDEDLRGLHRGRELLRRVVRPREVVVLGWTGAWVEARGSRWTGILLRRSEVSRRRPELWLHKVRSLW